VKAIDRRWNVLHLTFDEQPSICVVVLVWLFLRISIIIEVIESFALTDIRALLIIHLLDFDFCTLSY
jgi:hypothetical protein